MAAAEGDPNQESLQNEAATGDAPGTSAAEAPRDPTGGPSLSKRKRKLVKRLEKKLELYQRKIRQTMEQEVTLEEMDSDTSPYLKEDQLKRQLVKKWYELCELLHLSPEIQLHSEYTQRFDSTPYPQINRYVERLLRKDEFPDYCDMVQLIEKVSEKHSLGIKEKERHILGRKVFHEVGERIKQNRLRSWQSLFSSYLVEGEEDGGGADPALGEPELMRRLEESVEEGRKRLDDLYEEYALRQEKEGDKTGSSSDGEEEEEERGGKRARLEEDLEGGVKKEEGEEVERNGGTAANTTTSNTTTSNTTTSSTTTSNSNTTTSNTTNTTTSNTTNTTTSSISDVTNIITTTSDSAIINPTITTTVSQNGSEYSNNHTEASVASDDDVIILDLSDTERECDIDDDDVILISD